MSDQVEVLAEQDGKVEGEGETQDVENAAEATVETAASNVVDDMAESAAESSNPAAPAAAAPAEEPSAEVVPAVETPVAETPTEETPTEANPASEMVAEGAPVEPVAAESVQAEEKAAYVSASKAMVAEGAPVEDAAPAAAGEETSEAATGDADKEPSAEAHDQARDDARDAENKRVVRTLSVGQQVTGTVKRVADFGAFVDIGVGRDGLIHISELSVRRVGKVTDMLNEGQEVTAWIKKLDRDRNRISLTLIDPGTKTIRDLEKGELVQGTVTRILPYGAFVDIGVGRDALLHVREMGEGYVAKPEDVVKVGESIEARIIELSRRRGRVDLSLKGLRAEPEPVQTTPSQQQQPQAANEPEEEAEDDFAEVEVLSPMELAFKKAMQAEGIELNVTKKSGKRNRRDRTRSIQDEIVARTLSSGKK